MSEEVKPCPFCGGEAWLREWGSGWALTCRHNRTLARFADFTDRECDIAIVLAPTKAEAITAWNTRPGEEAAYEAGRAAERERIVAALEVVEAQYRDEERRADWVEEQVRCARAANHFLHAIAIAREEGGT